MEFISHIVDTMNGFYGASAFDSHCWNRDLFDFQAGFLQVRLLLYSLKLAFSRHQDKSSEGDISHFQALMTALAATVGTGNIVGVASAVIAGGPGAVFWMWLAAFFGMATKYAEAVLAVRFRVKDKTAKCQAVRCIIWNTASSKSGLACYLPYSGRLPLLE